MKVYVASSFKFIPRVEIVVEALEYAGHEITCKWWKRAYQSEGLGLVDTQELKKLYANLESDEFFSKPETKKSYFADLDGIEEANVLVLVGPDKASRTDFVGANIELGYALGCGMACFSIGALMNSAMYYGVVKCKTIEELDAELKELEEEF